MIERCASAEVFVALHPRLGHAVHSSGSRLVIPAMFVMFVMLAMHETDVTRQTHA